jgi:hypothetical protein
LGAQAGGEEVKNINVEIETKEVNGLKKVILKWNFPGCNCPCEAETQWMETLDDIEDVVCNVLIDIERLMRINVFCKTCGQPWTNSLPEC